MFGFEAGEQRIFQAAFVSPHICSRSLIENTPFGNSARTAASKDGIRSERERERETERERECWKAGLWGERTD